MFAELTARLSYRGRRGRLSAEIDLDDFLANIHELSTWTHPEVNWDEDLMALVNDVLDDTEMVQQRLDSRTHDSGVDLVESKNVAELLGAGWTADLTSFQERDIARLLSLRHGANFSVPGAGKTLGISGMGVANDIEVCIEKQTEDRDLFGPDGPMLTVKQAAIIQGFPPEWDFSGGKTARYRQVGNAFPPPVARAVGESILDVLRAARE